MKVYLKSDVSVFDEFDRRLTRANHEVFYNKEDISKVDLFINLSRYSSRFEPLGLRHSTSFPIDIPIYSLCYGSGVSSGDTVYTKFERQIGFSILPPITESSMLEIARPLQTPISELEKARSFFESLGFMVVEVPDGPGLIQARIVACLANEAMSALAEGVAGAKTIDTAVKLGTNYPLGPLEWAELIGLESILAIMEGLQSEYGEDRYRPHPLLKRLVAAGMSVAEYEAWKRGER